MVVLRIFNLQVRTPYLYICFRFFTDKSVWVGGTDVHTYTGHASSEDSSLFLSLTKSKDLADGLATPVHLCMSRNP